MDGITEIRVYLEPPDYFGKRHFATSGEFQDLMLETPLWQTRDEREIQRFVEDLTCEVPHTTATENIRGPIYDVIAVKGRSMQILCFGLFTSNANGDVLSVAVRGANMVTWGYDNQKMIPWIELFKTTAAQQSHGADRAKK